MSDTRKSSAVSGVAVSAAVVIALALVPGALAMSRRDPAELVFGLSPQFWSGFMIGLMVVLLVAGIAGLYTARAGRSS